MVASKFDDIVKGESEKEVGKFVIVCLPMRLSYYPGDKILREGILSDILKIEETNPAVD